MANSQLQDVLIIGSSYAGLGVATGLVRQSYKMTIFDEGVYRNSISVGMRNLAGWDGQLPEAFRSKARSDLLKYKTVQFEQATIQKVRKTDQGHFEAQDGQGRTWHGKKLVIATGVEEIFPDIPGFKEAWGYGIIACLFCLETDVDSSASSGALCVGHAANVDTALTFSHMARRYTKKVTLYTNGNDELAAKIEKELEKDKGGRAGLITVNNKAISRLARGTGSTFHMIVTLSDGTEVKENFLMGRPVTKPRGPFIDQLSLKKTSAGHIETSVGFETSVKGVFAAGDCVSQFNSLSRALWEGSFAAGGVAGQLGAENASID